MPDDPVETPTEEAPATPEEAISEGSCPTDTAIPHDDKVHFGLAELLQLAAIAADGRDCP